eukprot:333746-Alexandrium_andersonii.AAC.1
MSDFARCLLAGCRRPRVTLGPACRSRDAASQRETDHRAWTGISRDVSSQIADAPPVWRSAEHAVGRVLRDHNEGTAALQAVLSSF